MDILTRYQTVKDKIEKAAEAAHRDPATVHLVAVSKTFEADAIRPLLDAGHRVFGENRVQEAQGKWPVLKRDFADVVLHLIGPLQSNKAVDAVALFDVIETVDRQKIVTVLAKEMAKQARRLQCRVQVNTGDESQKAGVRVEEASGFISFAQRHLLVSGLMCIPPVTDSAAKHFQILAALARDFNLPMLSMGMSGDFEDAIRAGATHVRVGSAIFGAR
jgi:PLP dependent protein